MIGHVVMSLRLQKHKGARSCHYAVWITPYKSAIYDLPQYWFCISCLCILVYDHPHAVEGSLAITDVFGKVIVVNCEEDTSSSYDIGRQVMSPSFLHLFKDFISILDSICKRWLYSIAIPKPLRRFMISLLMIA